MTGARTEVDVAVVGGGLSGLAIADRLQRAGVDYILLEARDRLGGRVLSIDVDGAKFDLGPAWFWPGQHRMRAAVERFGLKVFEQHSAGDSVVEDHVGGVTRGVGLASMRGSYRIDGGIGRLIDGFAASLPPSRIRLDARVRSFEQETSGVSIAFDEAGVTMSIRARSVILAAPPRVVDATMGFKPELPAGARQVLRSIPTWMAGQAKIVAVYDRPYWRDAGFSGDVVSRRGPMAEIHDACAGGGPAALFGFVGVPPEVRRQHHNQMMDETKHQLAHIFGEKLLEPRALILHDWARDPLTSTAQDHAPSRSHPTYGPTSALDGLWEDRLRFCVTETAPQFGGYLEGAFEAAEGLILPPWAPAVVNAETAR